MTEPTLGQRIQSAVADWSAAADVSGHESDAAFLAWCEVRTLCDCADAAWNEAVASRRPPTPEPEPVTPRRWWWVSLTAMLGGWGEVAYFSGAFCGNTRSAAIDRAREEVAARDDGRGGDWAHAKPTANELTPAALATMLAESRAWYARELERSGEVME